MMDFITEKELKYGSWQSFERSVCRLLIADGFSNVRMTGGTGDKGADVIATKFGKRWLFQVKQWKKPVGVKVVDETLSAMRYYDAQIPVIVAANGFEQSTWDYWRELQANNIPLQLWSSKDLIERFSKLKNKSMDKRIPREYQEQAIRIICENYHSEFSKKTLIVLATGLGKTFVASEAIRKINETKPIRVLVIAHSVQLIRQLERSFWPFLKSSQSTIIWDGTERPNAEMLSRSDFVFACVDSVCGAVKRQEMYDFDMMVIDECHHAGSETYRTVIDSYLNETDPPFLLGLTATPWRADEVDLKSIFGNPEITIDMIYGMKHGFLSNVDYRIHTDNIDWDSLKNLKGQTFSPRQINKTFFINQWDDAVIEELRRVWPSVQKPRAIVFCGTIDHAEYMANRIRALDFCKVDTVTSTKPMSENNKILEDFADDKINVVCAVDIFNEGIDVPDVNILVFQRVTHSRRIFIQQLGRGLRISEGKEKVIVLDFVSDIRRFAATLDLKAKIDGKGVRLDLPNRVTFTRITGEDVKAESFLREWLDDVVAIEDSDEDASVLKYPPILE